ncbi:MAG: leucine--tRNA ligase [Verrucomicrobiota bacterium]|nr:MAG: leucine--tRNA ligase [Verrucomicrobiota bacterium]
MVQERASYDFQKIEPFWQKKWLEGKTFCAQDGNGKKYYALDMFPYPSGAGLHIGHPEGYTASDILVRYKWAKGYNVLHPMGWDAFGLPAEQHAIATGKHPSINTAANIDRFRTQIQSLGFAIDWDREVNTTSPDYYRWTQWIFLQLFKHGLAYVGDKPVWWCPELRAVLSNEEVIDGKSERGEFPVERRNLRQWVLRITRYADRLLEGLNDLDWPDSTKRQQIEWIGRSEGAEVDFEVVGNPREKISVYTTRPDTLYGATFLVIAPEHPLVSKITSSEQRKAVDAYVEQAKHKSDLERTGLAKDKTGVFSGSYARNPLNGREIPIWIADYVLISYGTGAIMAVPAHDERDYAFAKEFHLPIIPVIQPSDPSQAPKDQAYIAEGVMINSGPCDGLTNEEAKKKVIEILEEQGCGNRAIQYKLRDWLFSRQRYWGEPIPILWIERAAYDQALQSGKAYFKDDVPQEAVSYTKDGVEWCAIPVAWDQLPLKLPEVTSYLPSDSGESPLANAQDWLHVYVDLHIGAISQNSGEGKVPATRETNTMPQWAGSCWYYLRYLSPHEEAALVNPEAEAYWGCPDFYIGGAEHAVLHLLYARFWHQFLYDIGAIKASKEPFPKLYHQGIILGSDGSKMSKSRGNVINPDDIVQQYGADSLRLYEMFLGPLNAMKPWSERGIEGVHRFLKKVWTMYIGADGETKPFIDVPVSEVEKSINETIEKVTNDIEMLQFNTAISQMMIFVNNAKNHGLTKEQGRQFLQLLAPFAPHIAEELWYRIGEPFSIAHVPWPVAKTIAKSSTQKIVVQINGKVRGELEVPSGTGQAAVEEKAQALSKIEPYLRDHKIIKKIYIPGKILNIVVE